MHAASPLPLATAAVVALAAACAYAPPATPPAAPAPDAATAERMLLAAEAALFAAIAHRDTAALATLVTDAFVLRVPGSPDVHADAFPGLVLAVPGEILSVTGEALDARALAPDLGVVSGVQVMRLRLDGAEVTDRTAFLD